MAACSSSSVGAGQSASETGRVPCPASGSGCGAGSDRASGSARDSGFGGSDCGSGSGCHPAFSCGSGSGCGADLGCEAATVSAAGSGRVSGSCQGAGIFLSTHGYTPGLLAGPATLRRRPARLLELPRQDRRRLLVEPEGQIKAGVCLGDPDLPDVESALGPLGEPSQPTPGDGVMQDAPAGTANPGSCG